MNSLAEEIEARLEAQGVRLTMGGEPTYLPDEPTGVEWRITAVGPTKLRYAYALARQLIAQRVPNALTLFSPGKLYPGEVNPRWVVNLLWRRDGSFIAPLFGAKRATKPDARLLGRLRTTLSRGLGLDVRRWLRGVDPYEPARPIWVLPLDHDASRGWITGPWLMRGRAAQRIGLLRAEGPAGLRLPLAELPDDALKRALVMEIRDGAIRVFLPPLLEAAFAELVGRIGEGCLELGVTRESRLFFEGYVPIDASAACDRLGLTADPGVLEVNLPACERWSEYAVWLADLEKATHGVGLRSWKMDEYRGLASGTGGGNHLLFGGPTLETNPFFSRPAWVASLLRYFQAHPSLAYLFTGSYVGASSQAPRPDESGRNLHDLELAYAHLASLPEGDQRGRIGETLRHLHTDASGNTHRSETSFDKFWEVGLGTGFGLIEFRAIESLPHASWMSAVALLWRAILLHTLEHPAGGRLQALSGQLHDAYFLPSTLWRDLAAILEHLSAAGLPAEALRATLHEIWDWRFPAVLEHAGLVVRRACEGWPLLCETPVEGGHTSRFVDTSMERLEFRWEGDAATAPKIRVNGRPLALLQDADGSLVCGLRYRRTAWYPSLHPGIAPQVPLVVEVGDGPGRAAFAMDLEEPNFRATDAEPAPGEPVQRAGEGLLTYDLRL